VGETKDKESRLSVISKLSWSLKKDLKGTDRYEREENVGSNHYKVTMGPML
jgi:hypothetical protein